MLLLLTLALYAIAAIAGFTSHETMIDSPEWELDTLVVRSKLPLRLVFAIPQRNLQEAHDRLMAVSHPSSPTYGQHLSFEEVGALTSNPESCARVEGMPQYLRKYS